MIRPKDARWTIDMYRPVNQGGYLVLQTWHRSDASKDMEIGVCRNRQARGELGRVVLHDHELGVETEIV